MKLEKCKVCNNPMEGNEGSSRRCSKCGEFHYFKRTLSVSIRNMTFLDD
jgi:hypothetical protein